MKSGLYALSKTRAIANAKTKELIYESLINSHFRYASLLWFPGMKKELKTKMTSIQKMAIRIITNQPRNSHTAPLFKQLGMLKLEDQFELSTLIMAKSHISLKSKLPASLAQKLEIQIPKLGKNYI